MRTNRNATLTPPAMPRRGAMTLLSIASCLLLATGCGLTKTQIREIPADRYVRTVRKYETFTAPCDGKFVPQAQFLDMAEAYERESYRTQNP